MPNTDPNPITATAGRDIRSALAKISQKQPALTRFYNYYNGEHEFNFGSEKFTTQFARRLKTMRDNLCKTVVKAPSDRLEIIGFSNDKDSTLYGQTWDIWKRSQMPRLAKRVHREAFKTGDAYAIVWAGADGKARIVPQDSRLCAVWYDPETNEVDHAAKLWHGADKFVYLTLYYPDRIEKYISNVPQTEGATPTTDRAFRIREVDGEAWPVAIPPEYGGCPMFHFGREDSILSDVIPLNDALNKELADMLIGSESNSLRQRWTSGITYEIDPETGKQIIPFDRAAQWFASQDPNAKFGEFKDVTLKDFLDVVNDFRNEIANVAGIPQYYFRLGVGNFPSGEALAKAESRFTTLITDAQLDFRETWAAALKMAIAIDNADGAAGAEGELETTWRDASPMSTNEKLDVAIKKKSIGVSDEQNLSELGYTDADIKKMKDQNAASTQAAGDAFGKVFNAGSSIVN